MSMLELSVKVNKKVLTMYSCLQK